MPVLRNGDVYYPFRVDSDFLAWTGMDIEGAILLTHLQTHEQILFFDEPSDQKRLWESITWDTRKIRESGFVGKIMPRMELASLLESLEGEFLLPENNVASTKKEYAMLRVMLAGKPISSADRHLIAKRLVKSASDQEKIKKAIQMTEKTYEYILEHIRPGMYEYEVEAMIAYQFRLQRGVEAFPSIIASGPSACTLHYTAHDRKIEAGDLVLIDFGIELDGYGADISRTFPVSGQFTPRQQEIYDALQDAKKYAESMLKPWISRKNWNLAVKEYMFQVCQQLWLPDIEKYTPLTNVYFPHSIGHFLGLDTHDVGDSDMPLAPGMILTIEPGIYMPAEGIGIRIEDDYLVTATSCEKIW